MMNTHLCLTPARLDDAVTGRRGGKQNFKLHPSWSKAQRKKGRNLGFRPGTPLPDLDRHDFPPRKSYARAANAACLDYTYESPIRAVITALGMGSKSHARQIVAADPVKVADRLWERDQQISQNVRTPALADILRAAIELEAVKDFWAIADYDSLIAAVATTGPVVITLPWYEGFLPEREFNTSTGRAVKPWGDMLGLTSLCISGYSANGLLVRVEHTETWQRSSFLVLEEHIVSLLNEQGEVYAFDRADPNSPIALYS